MRVLVSFNTDDKTLEVLASGDSAIELYFAKRNTDFPDSAIPADCVPVVPKGETFYGDCETGYVLLEV